MRSGEKIDLYFVEMAALAAQGRYDPEILAEVGVYHGNAATFVAEVGTPDVVLSLVRALKEVTTLAREFANRCAGYAHPAVHAADIKRIEEIVDGTMLAPMGQP